MDLSRDKIRRYIDKFPEARREEIARILIDGESLVNAFDSPDAQILFDVLTVRVQADIEKLLQLVKAEKYKEDEELKQIRIHCIGINKYMTLVQDWRNRLTQVERNIENMEKRV